MDAPVAPTDVARKALLAGTYRALGLEGRMPMRFKARGWALDDRAHIASAAVCCVKLGVGLTSFKVPPGTNDSPEWKALYGGASASRIVEALELGDMLDPPAIAVAGRIRRAVDKLRGPRRSAKGRR